MESKYVLFFYKKGNEAQARRAAGVQTMEKGAPSGTSAHGCFLPGPESTPYLWPRGF